MSNKWHTFSWSIFMLFSCFFIYTPGNNTTFVGVRKNRLCIKTIMVSLFVVSQLAPTILNPIRKYSGFFFFNFNYSIPNRCKPACSLQAININKYAKMLKNAQQFSLFFANKYCNPF